MRVLDLLCLVSTPEELCGWMCRNIELGYKTNGGEFRSLSSPINREDGFIRDYVHQSPEELLSSGVGVSFDQVELIRRVFSEWKIPCRAALIYQRIKGMPAHSFVCFQRGTGPEWIETCIPGANGLGYGKPMESVLAILEFMRGRAHDNENWGWTWYQELRKGVGLVDILGEALWEDELKKYL